MPLPLARSQARRAHEQRLLVHVPRGVRPASGGARARRRRTLSQAGDGVLLRRPSAVRVCGAVGRGSPRRRSSSRPRASERLRASTRGAPPPPAGPARPARTHARPARAHTLTAAPAQHWRVSLCPTSVLKAAHPPCPLVSQAPTRTSSWRMLAPWMEGEGGRRSVPLRLVPRGRLCYD